MKLQNLHELNLRQTAQIGLLGASLATGTTKSQEPEKPRKPPIERIEPKEELPNFIAKWEKFEPKAYQDTPSNLSIGYGFNLSNPDAKERLTKLGLNPEKIITGKQTITNQQALQLLKSDAERSYNEAIKFCPNLKSQPPIIQMIVADIAYNIGEPRLTKFTKFKDALNNNNFTKAAQELKNSKWYNQVGDRGKHHVNELLKLQKTVKEENEHKAYKVTFTIGNRPQYAIGTIAINPKKAKMNAVYRLTKYLYTVPSRTNIQTILNRFTIIVEPGDYETKPHFKPK